MQTHENDEIAGDLPYAEYFPPLMESVSHAILFCYECNKILRAYKARANNGLKFPRREARLWVRNFFNSINFQKDIQEKLSIPKLDRKNIEKIGKVFKHSLRIRNIVFKGFVINTKIHSDKWIFENIVIEGSLLYLERLFNDNTFEIEIDNYSLWLLFKRFEKPSFSNHHIKRGLSLSDQERKRIYPRLVNLTVQAFKESLDIESTSGICLPSPFYIICSALTVPDEPHTTSYGFLTCRSKIFSLLRCHPEHPWLKGLPKTQVYQFKESEILDSISTFSKHNQIQLRWPDVNRLNKDAILMGKSRVNYCFSHIMAAKGYFHMWFANARYIRDFYKEGFSNSQKGKNKFLTPTFAFRLSSSYITPPGPGEVINTVFGIPLSVRGGETVFFGGIKKTIDGGIVVNLKGKPGAGKTSVALSLAALFSPLGTKSYYISLEENRKDLFNRLETLTPEFLRELDIYTRPTDIDKNEWFFCHNIRPHLSAKQITVVLEDLRRKLGLTPNSSGGLEKEETKGKPAFDSGPEINAKNVRDYLGIKYLPSPCPALVVIDNINELFKGYADEKQLYSDLENFVEECRSIGALVILISADELPDKIGLDYLVDVSIHLRQENTEAKNDKPLRIFQLVKTRHQISRQGSHIFHLSTPSGFRISPQVPSQMNRKESIKRALPDYSKRIHFINTLEKCAIKNKKKNCQTAKVKRSDGSDFLDLFPNSNILVHGYGSSGKAGFALKLLLTPPISASVNTDSHLEKNFFWGEKSNIQQDPEWNFSPVFYRRKVLVISFLYPEDYYRYLIDEKIEPSLKGVYSGISKSRCDILNFFPGFLLPEDFINKVIRKLDSAILEGEPYTGVLLDGLHNVFLQFQNLQNSNMVWPLLYNILSRYKLTVVSTFTNFSINDKHIETDDTRRLSQIPQSMEDYSLMQKGMTPFLNGLVKASDYYFLLEEKFYKEAGNEGNFKRKYFLSVKSTIRQELPYDLLEWDIVDLQLKGKVKPEQLFATKDRVADGIETMEKQLQEMISIQKSRKPLDSIKK